MSIFDWMNPARWIMLLAICGSLALGYFSWRSHERGIGAAPYIAQIAQIRAVGEAAQQAANEKTRIDISRKRMADDENKTATDTLNATVKRLRDANSGRGNLSAPAPTAQSPTRTCFDPAKFDAALRELDEGFLGIVESGSQAVIDLDTAKQWADDTRPK